MTEDRHHTRPALGVSAVNGLARCEHWTCHFRNRKSVLTCPPVVTGRLLPNDAADYTDPWNKPQPDLENCWMW